MNNIFAHSNRSVKFADIFPPLNKLATRYVRIIRIPSACLLLVYTLDVLGVSDVFTAFLYYTVFVKLLFTLAY